MTCDCRYHPDGTVDSCDRHYKPRPRVGPVEEMERVARLHASRGKGNLTIRVATELELLTLAYRTKSGRRLFKVGLVCGILASVVGYFAATLW